MTKNIDKIVYEIIEDAQRYLKESKDDKYFTNPSEFLMVLQKALDDGIGPGNEAIRLNRMQTKGNYVHDIIYKGINFVTATPKKITFNYE
ncbi:MAG: hypothetical protein N3G19_02465 [Candidatus Pacearchaeota archaeon]|nr:hypothetical protein [Candidatus Pacearchaeota archaeon]